MTARRKVKVKRTVRRANPPRVLSRNVIAIQYRHAHSKQRTPYEHRFDRGVQMIANHDGSITLRHPTRRIWGTYTVSDSE